MQGKKIQGKSKWEIGKRLEFIEKCLFWRGRIKRANLMDYFGISGVQATADLTKYQEMAPQNAIYDSSAKSYLIAPTFKPILTNPTLDDLQTTSILLDATEGTAGRLVVSTLPSMQRHIDNTILQAVLYAIQNCDSLEIKYQSMSTPNAGWRWISPHALAHDGRRWHIRAYCYSTNEFKDFLLARIINVRGTRQSIIFGAEDQEWNEIVTLKIVPHPGLSDNQKKVIESDFGMVDGVLLVKVRKALKFYFFQQYNLLEPHTDPAIQQIVIKNGPE